MQLIPVGDDFDVRSDVDQYSAAYQVIQLTGGRILALWTEYSWAGHSSGSGYVMDDVYARLYEANGTAVGSQFRVNASDLSIQAEPSATALDDGGFLVAWQTYTSGTSYLSQPIIVATRYDANGTAQTGEISVASAVGEGVESSELTNLGNGTVLLSYTEDQPYPAPSILKGVVLNAAGAPTGIPFEIGTAKFYSGAQSVAVLNNGNLMVSWSGVDSDSMGIYARVLSPTGVPVTGPILVNTDETSQQTYPETAVLADGSVIVVWQDGIVGDYNDVNARRVAADGSFLTDPFVVETIHTGGDQSRPDVIALSDGGFLIAWQTGDTWGEYDVVARRYDANGEPIDIETTLSSDAGGPEGFSPQLLELQDGRIAAFWEAFTWGGTSDMVMRLFEAQTFGTADPDVILGGGTSNWIDGLAGDDTLSGMGGNDALFGGDGDDLLNGGAGNDLIDGGSGSDRVDYSTAWENLMVNISYAGAQRVSTGQGKDTFVSIEGILGGAGNDLLVGSAAADFIDGGAGNDEIYGIGAGDILNGGAGDDLIEGSGGNDTMNGGAGNDTLSYYHSAEGVYVNPILGTASGAGNDRFWGFENFYGSNIGDDFLVGNFNANRIIGFGGNDSIRGETGDDDLLGMQGNDTLLGGDGADTLTGGHGDDVLSGGAGNDLIDGGEGSDRVDYSTAIEDLVVNINYAGAQEVSSLQGMDTFVSIEGILGGAGNDLLVGSAAADVIDGGAGNDEIYGLGAGDILNGGEGNDLIEGSDGNDTMNGGAGTGDVLSFYHSAGAVQANLIWGVANGVGAGSDTFLGFEILYGSNIGNDTLVGGFDDDQILGFGGEDLIYGALGDDYLLGMQGNDTLYGGVGADTLRGGEGADVFDFDFLNQSTGTSRDTIFDFGVGGADRVDVSGVDAISQTQTNEAFTFIGSAAFSAAGQLRFATNGTDGFVLCNVNGNLEADMTIVLIGITSVMETDFIL